MQQLFNHLKSLLLLTFTIAMFNQHTLAQNENEPEIIAADAFTALYNAASKKCDSAATLIAKQEDKKSMNKNKAAAKKLYESAIKDYEAAILLKPKSYGAYYNLGLTQLKTEKYKKAIVNFTIASQLDTSQNNPYRERAMAWKGRKKFDEAIADLDTAININYDDYEAFYQRGLLREASNKKKAFEDYTRTIELKIDYAAPYYRRALINYNEFKDVMYAHHDIKLAVQYDSANIELYYWLGKIKFDAGDYKGAEKALSQYLDGGDSLNIDALITRGATRTSLNNYSGALADLNLVIKLDKKNYVAYAQRGLAKGCLKQYKEALADLDMAAKLKFDFSPIYINRALVKFQMRDKDGACADLNRAASLNHAKADELLRQYCPK